MRISKETEDKIKEEILRVVRWEGVLTTFDISKIIGRSWELTNRLLLQLVKDGKIKKESTTKYMILWKKEK